ncbi:hypothetical protein B0T25DRAFT_442042 [Lasiosphaeria hispida]|uniref:J domain-containing protein n=1 Tax=Lasiosphaeria hispida TaxID=260671 RepID=A0AAJ0HTP0_9PEZI|nr:hypothetical protein B0T25DRAFT_442042 [Lasiosphaeria hispida]
MTDARSRRAPSGAYEDSGSVRGGYYAAATTGSHRLRPTDSRFSLRDQFASTRREYEFGFDDTSSFLERSSIASEAIWGADHDDTVVVGTEPTQGQGPYFTPSFIYRDYYELLCLPRDPSLSPEELQRQFHRLVQVLCVDRQPARLQSAAAFNLGLAQAAFETLVEPCRRIGYDLSVVKEDDSEIAEVVAEGGLIGPSSSDAYESALQDQYLLLAQGGIRTTTDMGLRLEAWSRRGRRHGTGFGMLDFSLRQSVTVAVPPLREPFERTATLLLDITSQSQLLTQTKRSIHFTDPTITITGAAHGLLDEPFKLMPLLLDRYQPPGPSVHGRRRLEQLLVSRFLPILNLNVRQELFWREAASEDTVALSSRKTIPDSVIEQDIEFLPHPSTTIRLGHSINVPGVKEPLNVELSVQKLLRFRNPLAPSLGLALHQNAGPGTAFLVADAGDWQFRPSQECREVSKFSKVTGGFPQMIDTFRNAPTLEVGYAFGSHRMGVQSERPFTKPADRGVRGMDCDLDDSDRTGPWTVSTGLSSGVAATYLRYGRDLFSLLTGNSSGKRSNIRAEVELASSTQRDFFLAFRALKRIGKFSKAGLELGLTPNNVHLSLYWSRLGQRISLPFLVARKSSLSTRFLFWAAVVPFAAFAAVELVYRQIRLRLSKTSVKKTPPSLSKEGLQGYIGRRRAEADELTVILATGVEPRQNRERLGGGLVILSAKYGVRDATPDEIADVTIAVAALVDGGRLVIPKGMRKSRLLGFWDPAPMTLKVLSVRYMYQGKEKTVEVSGRGELKLP